MSLLIGDKISIVNEAPVRLRERKKPRSTQSDTPKIRHGAFTKSLQISRVDLGLVALCLELEVGGWSAASRIRLDLQCTWRASLNRVRDKHGVVGLLHASILMLDLVEFDQFLFLTYYRSTGAQPSWY